MRFSERVKQVKKDKGITNEALSEASGIPLGTLGKLLSGFTEEPKLSTAVAIAEALGCSLEYLATGKEEALTLSADETAMIKRYRALDAHGTRVCDYILNEEYMRVAERTRNVVANVPAAFFREEIRRGGAGKTAKPVAKSPGFPSLPTAFPPVPASIWRPTTPPRSASWTARRRGMPTLLCACPATRWSRATMTATFCWLPAVRRLPPASSASSSATARAISSSSAATASFR